jgi:hypothetical protein
LIKKNPIFLKLNAVPIKLLQHDHLVLSNEEAKMILTHVLVVVIKVVAQIQATGLILNVNLLNTRDPI